MRSRTGTTRKLQITTKIKKLVAYGHDPSKMELVIVGGTFLFMPLDYQTGFIKSCYDALNGTDSGSLEEAKSNNEHARIRSVGITIETKPDYCRREHVDAMLDYGVTRIEIGVQSLQERVYRIVNRGHSYADVTESFQTSKDAGYKIVAHMMPGLPTVTPDEDIADFERLFADPQLRPDMLKIYPSLVIPGTPLFDEYNRSGRYAPYSEEETVRVIAEAKRSIPKWVRIMRVAAGDLPRTRLPPPKIRKPQADGTQEDGRAGGVVQVHQVQGGRTVRKGCKPRRKAGQGSTMIRQAEGRCFCRTRTRMDRYTGF